MLNFKLNKIMKRILLLFAILIMTAVLSAQKSDAKIDTQYINATSDECFDEAYTWFYGDIYVHQGQVSTYTVMNPFAGHTYEFSVPIFHGVMLGYTATTVTVLWSTPGGGYGTGYIDMVETNELGCVKYRTKNIAIVP